MTNWGKRERCAHNADYANTLHLTTGHVRYSNRSRPMLPIGEDQVGRHDFTLTPCSPETFQIIYKNTDFHPNCFENLAKALGQFGIEPDQIPTTINVFMDVSFDLGTGEMTIAPPPSKAGQFVEFHAEMDLYVGVTACSAELSKNGAFKPIDVEVYSL